MQQALVKLREFIKPAPIPEDITVKQINRDVLKLVWPSALELFLVSLTGTIDMIMIGSLGPWAIAAIGLTNQPKFILMALFMAMNTGTTAMVSRFRGMQEPALANATMRQSLTLTAALSVVLSAIMYLLTPWVMEAMGAREDTLIPSIDYLRIQVMAFPVQAITMAITAALRGVGNTRASMVYNLSANVLKVLFNLVLIFGHLGFPAMGVKGASISTVLAQIAAAAIALGVLFRGKTYLKISIGDSFKPDFELIKRIANIGWPAMIEQFIMRAGMLFFARIIAELGTIAYSTHQIAMNIMNYTFMNGQAFGIAATAFIGMNLGKGRADIAQAYVRSARRMGMIISVSMAAIFLIFGRQMFGLFLIGSDDIHKTEIIEMGYQILWIMAILQPMQSSQLILNGALRGAGDTRSTAMVMFIGVLLIRPLASYLFVFPLELGLLGAWYATVFDQVFRSVFSFIRFQLGKWKYIRV